MTSDLILGDRDRLRLVFMVHDLLEKSPKIKKMGLECIVLTEVIEHIPFKFRFKVVANILGYLRPQCLIITTPNYDFNYFFNDCDKESAKSKRNLRKENNQRFLQKVQRDNGLLRGNGERSSVLVGIQAKEAKGLRSKEKNGLGRIETSGIGAKEGSLNGEKESGLIGSKRKKYPFRNDDHKYEPTQRQFRKFTSKCLEKWWGRNYSLTIDGVGVHETHGTERGYASQVAIFQRKSEEVVKREFIRPRIIDKSSVAYDKQLIRSKATHFDLYLSLLQLSR